MSEPDLSLPELCGQLIVSGFSGLSLPAELASALAAGQRGGVILFKRNVANVEAVHALTQQIAHACPRRLPPFIGVDQEGGRVRRIPSPLVQLPAMRVLGRSGDPDLVRRAASVLARELGAVGFNLNFAPVLDVDSNPQNPVIGDRAFSSDAETVVRLGRAYVEALQAAGVMACGKHFPGHGDTSKDSHADLPFVEHDRARLDAVELPPFRAASHARVAALMTAHVVYRALDPGVPATLSRAVCTTLLRNELGFRGVLFSDDLEMRALSDRFGIEQSAVRAIRAGADALLVCSDLELAERAHEALVAQAEGDESFRQRCSEAVRRSLAARRHCPPHPAASVEELRRALDSVEARALLREG